MEYEEFQIRAEAQEKMKQRIAKIIALFLAIMLLLCGTFLFIAGVSVEVLRNVYEPISTFAALPSILAIALSLAVITTGILGIVGIKNRKLHLNRMFLIVSALLLIIEIVLGILCFNFTENVAGNLSKNLNFAMDLYGMDEEYTKAIDKMQVEFKCCGYENFLDWNMQNSQTFDCTLIKNTTDMNTTVCARPYSCCKLDDLFKEANLTKCMVEITTNLTTSLYKGNVSPVGCGNAFRIWIETMIDIVGIACLSLTAPQAVGILAVHIFIQRINERKSLYLVE